MVKKRKTNSQLEKDLDIAFSRYIRGRDCGGKEGYGTCITCGHIITYYTCEAGHFLKRGRRNVRWDPRNAHGQCWSCNRDPKDLKIMERDYREGLEIRIGASRLEDLERAAASRAVPGRAEKEELLVKYRKLAREFAV